MKVLVTGGGGFVGRALIPRLVADGHQVVATSRDGATRIPGASVVQVGELGADTDWRRALDGVEAVIHLAARVHVMKDAAADPLAEYLRVNTEGTARLASQAINAGIDRFIFLSTIKVNGEATHGRPFRADDTPDPHDPYAFAKLEAERALQQLTKIGAVRLDIVRPPLVYGPGVRGNFLSLLGLCRRGWPLPLGGIDNRRSLIYVGNLADLLARLLEGRGSVGVHLCRDDEDVSTPELFRRAGAALGVRVPLPPFPVALLRLAGMITGRAAAVARLTDSLAVDDTATRHDLDWTPPFSMLKGLEETANWYANRRQD